MKSRAAENESLRRYLLGAMEMAEQERLEERLLTSADLQEELSAAENEIVYDYLTGALSEREREHFDKYFLRAPERRRKLEFFDTLIKSIDDLPKPLSDAHLPRPRWRRFLPSFRLRGKPLLRLSFAAGVVLLLLGAGWALIQRRSAGPVGGGASQLAVYTVTLSSDRSRDVFGTQTVRVNVPAGAKEVKFLFPLAEGDYPSYRAVLTAGEGGEKFRTDRLEFETTEAERDAYLIVPSSTLTPGDYQLKLYGLTPGGGFEEAEVYNFRVAR